MKYEELCDWLDILFSLETAFMEPEERQLSEIMHYISGERPNLMKERTDYGRSIFYMGILSKLLLAYLLSEIKEGKLLNKDFLGTIKDSSLDTYDCFKYYDCNYQTAEILWKIMKAVVCQHDYFKIDTCMGYSKDCDTDAEEMVGDIKEDYPSLSKSIIDELILQMENVEYYDNPVVETILFRSEILQQIKNREEEHPTDLGQTILTRSNCLRSVFKGECYRYDDPGMGEAYFVIFEPYIFGDDYSYASNMVERHHYFNYQCIFMINELIGLVKEYEGRYLSSKEEQAA